MAERTELRLLKGILPPLYPGNILEKESDMCQKFKNFRFELLTHIALFSEDVAAIQWRQNSFQKTQLGAFSHFILPFSGNRLGFRPLLISDRSHGPPSSQDTSLWAYPPHCAFVPSHSTPEQLRRAG